MRTTTKPMKKWTEALNRCLSNEAEYDICASELIKYFINEDNDKMETFLKLLEQSLTNQQSSPQMVFSSLRLLQEATEKRPKVFAKALSERKTLYSAIYQIATLQPSTVSSLSQQQDSNPSIRASHSELESESIKNKCIRLSIECILHWRLYFGKLGGDTGKLFRGLHAKLEKSGVALPNTVAFFSQQSHRAIETLIKTGSKSPEEADEISLEENTLVNLGSQEDDNEPELPTLNVKRQFSSLHSRKTALAQLEADLIGLRQIKIEEGKLYVQEGVTENPEEMRDRLNGFLKRVKDLLGEMKMKAKIFENLSPNKDEKRVLEEIASEEEELRQMQEHMEEKSAKPQRLEKRGRVFSYLFIKSMGSVLEDGLDAISPISNQKSNNTPSLETLANMMSSTKLPGTNVETDAFENATSGETGNPSLLSTVHQNSKPSSNNKLTIPLTNTGTKANEEKSSEVHPMVEKLNSIELKLRNQTSLEKFLKGVRMPGKIENSDYGGEPKKTSMDSSRVIRKAAHSATDNLSNRLLRRSLPSNGSEGKLKLGKELDDIAKGIQKSLSKGKISRSSISSNNRIGETSQQSISVASGSGRATPTYNLKLDFSKEIQNLLSTTSNISRTSLEQRKRSLAESSDGNLSPLIKYTSHNRSRDTELSESPNLKDDDYKLREHHKFATAYQNYQVLSPASSIRSHQRAMSPASDLQSPTKNPGNSSWSIDKISVSSTVSYNSGWVAIKDLAPSHLKEKIVVKEVVNTPTNRPDAPQGLPKQAQTSESQSKKVGRRPVIAVHDHGALYSKIKQRGILNSRTSSRESTPTSSKLKPKKESSANELGDKISLPLTARTTFKVSWHPLFDEMNQKLKTKKAMTMFKRTGLYSKGIIFDNETLNITAKLSRVEDLKSNRRLVKIFLLIGNKRGEYIRNFSLRIKKDPAIALTQPPIQNKPYIKPGKQLRAELVVGLADDHQVSHLEIVCIGEQVHENSAEKSELEATVYIPLTYFMFMESLNQLQDDDLTSPWTLRSDLVLQSSGKFKINADIVQTKAQFQSVFQHAVMFPNSDDGGENGEGRETYLGVIETDRLAEFIYLKFDWFPKTHEIVIQTASAPEKDKKGAFLLQTLLFLLGE